MANTSILMTRIAAAEAKNRFAELIERAENGEEIEITRYGAVVAKLVPPKPRKSDAEIEVLMQRVRENAEKLNIKFDWDEWKAYRDEGRR
jgi:prevent-host-death family protein